MMDNPRPSCFTLVRTKGLAQPEMGAATEFQEDTVLPGLES